MKKKFAYTTLLLIILSSLSTVCLNSGLVYATPYTDIDEDIAYEMITNGSFPDLVLLDVRTQSEYDSGHMYGAIWIPHTELEGRIDELAEYENDTIIVYCKVGGRSTTASGILNGSIVYNFTKIYNMLGGIDDWNVKGYPLWNSTVHNLNTTYNYDTIQAAIDTPHTLNGHTILVDEGIYYEHVDVNKGVILTGENRDTVFIDGNGTGSVVWVHVNGTTVSNFTIQKGGSNGPARESGILVSGASNCTILNNHLINNGWYGIYFSLGSHNTATNNLVENNAVGIIFYNSGQGIAKNNIVKNHSYTGLTVSSSPNSTVVNNWIENNEKGLTILYDSHTVYHNSIINNTVQNDLAFEDTVNWNKTEPFEGNYWSNYTGNDLDRDGIGDTPHIIDANNQDSYPLMGKYYNYKVTQNRSISVISNSSINSFEYIVNNSTIRLYVTNETLDQTHGFCRLNIPQELVAPPYNITINNGAITVLFLNDAIYDNGTHRWIYFAYQHTTNEIIIIPEFSLQVTLPLLLMGILFATLLRKHKK